MGSETGGNKESAQKAAADSKDNEMSFKAFLEQTPPDTTVTIIDFIAVNQGSQYLETPDLLLHCESEQCAGSRMFKCRDSFYIHTEWTEKFLTYVCRNCGTRLYRFALLYQINSLPIGTAMKFGQIPSFGPHTPSGLIRLIETDRELFLQGRRAENRGMGIGAFAYYRRVVENQRNQIIAKIAKVAKTLGSTPEIDQVFTAAINETLFTKSVEMVESFIPQALLINGENPLKLLHSALSKGLHNPEMTDAHCLRLAQSIRVVLTELADRSAAALKEDRELQQALNTLKAVPRGSLLIPHAIDTSSS
jgi:hypothetical protein